jgi:hypothetical protein
MKEEYSLKRRMKTRMKNTLDGEAESEKYLLINPRSVDILKRMP